MSTAIEQKVRINVRDVDTFKIIHGDFLLYFYPMSPVLKEIKCGTSDVFMINESNGFTNIQLFNKEEIRSYGYDPDSWSGNYIPFIQKEEAGNVYQLIPSEINLYLKKPE